MSKYKNQILRYQAKENHNGNLMDQVSVLKANFIKNLDDIHQSTNLILRDVVRLIEKEVSYIKMFIEIISFLFVSAINLRIFTPIVLTIILKYAPDVFQNRVVPIVHYLYNILYN